MLRAKFMVQKVTRFAWDTAAEEVELRAVYSTVPTSENYSWSKATPAALLTMTISNPDAVGKLELGKAYYIDFTPVGD